MTLKFAYITTNFDASFESFSINLKSSKNAEPVPNLAGIDLTELPDSFAPYIPSPPKNSDYTLELKNGKDVSKKFELGDA